MFYLLIHYLSFQPNYVGIINVAMKLKEVIERSCQFVSRVAQHKYGRIPELKLSGHVNAVFPYIECKFSDHDSVPLTKFYFIVESH